MKSLLHIYLLIPIYYLAILYSSSVLAQGGIVIRPVMAEDIEKINKQKAIGDEPRKPQIFVKYIFKTDLTGTIRLLGQSHFLKVGEQLEKEVPQNSTFYFFTEDEQFITDDIKLDFKEHEKDRILTQNLQLKNQYLLFTIEEKEKSDLASVLYSIQKNFVLPEIENEAYPRLKNFEISKYEVTVKQFEQFVKTTNYEKKDSSSVHQKGRYRYPRYRIANIDWRHDSKGEERPREEYEHPVVNVSWEEAQMFCNWLNENDLLYTYRLPTEKEWMYAAACGTHQYEYAWINSSRIRVDSFANLADISLKKSRLSEKGQTDINDGFALTSPVGKFKPNCFGLHDMTGNVAEWVQDDYEETRFKPKSKIPEKIHKGGSYYSSLSGATIKGKGHRDGTKRHGGIGFRLVRVSKL